MEIVTLKSDEEFALFKILQKLENLGNFVSWYVTFWWIKKSASWQK